MKDLFKILLFLVFLGTGLTHISAQEKGLKNNDYGFQISEQSIPKLAPSGFESVKTVELNTPLLPDKAYEVGFWIFGPQLKDRGYSFPIQVFPSNFMGAVDRKIFDLVESEDIMPTLKVNPPPTYTSKGHYTFIIRPDTLYNYVSVALKVRSGERPPINLREKITVTGIFVRPLAMPKEEEKEEKKDAVAPITIPETIAKRELIDSKKSYTVQEKELRIGLYDHRNIDKDRVTIYLNNEIIVEDLELKKKKQFFKASLKPGTNTITLHAENLGEVAPNTAAIIIKNKTQEFMAVLESDLGTSQYFTLIYEPN